MFKRNKDQTISFFDMEAKGHPDGKEICVPAATAMDIMRSRSIKDNKQYLTLDERNQVLEDRRLKKIAAEAAPKGGTGVKS